MLAQQVVALEGSNVDMKRQLEAQQRELQSEADELTQQVSELGGTNSELQRSLEAQQSELQVRIQRAQQDASQVCPLLPHVFPPTPAAFFFFKITKPLVDLDSIFTNLETTLCGWPVLKNLENF